MTIVIQTAWLVFVLYQVKYKNSLLIIPTLPDCLHMYLYIQNKKNMTDPMACLYFFNHVHVV